MAAHKFRIAIVGAASLRGKELAESLGDSVFADSDFVLLEEAESLGSLEAVGGEVTFVRELQHDSFEGADFVFFAGQPADAVEYASRAEQAGATVIDLTGALDAQPGAVLQSPWLQHAGGAARLDTPAVVIAHPAATVLALLGERLQKLAAIEFFGATVLEPASQQGRLAMDELHQQTVKLLGFQPLPKDIFDAQVAFNVLTESGENAETKLTDTEARIERQYTLLSGGELPPVSVLLAQAPVFHAYVISLHVRLAGARSLGAVKQSLAGEHVDVVADEPPSNLSASGQAEILVRARTAEPTDGETRDFKFWIAADNLRVSVQSAVSAAEQLRTMRPQGKVQ